MALPLLEQLQAVLQPYIDDAAWLKLFKTFGLDLEQAQTVEQLANLLVKPLDLSAATLTEANDLCTHEAMFDELHPQTQRAIERASPAKSLLFYIFSMPGLYPKSAQQLPPTLEQLDVIENYLYVSRSQELTDVDDNLMVEGVMPPNLDEINAMIKSRLGGGESFELAVVVFAKYFSKKSYTVNKVSADICYARTGVARVGTAEMRYDPMRRGYWPVVEDEPHTMAVLPGQYSAYIAVRLKGDSDHFGFMPDLIDPAADNGRSFWVPVHKLFSALPGECLRGKTIDLTWQASHLNQKLKKLHEVLKEREINLDVQNGDGEVIEAFDQYPFVIADDQLANLSENDSKSLALVVPVAHPLVERSTYSFNVPNPLPSKNSADLSLFYSSLQARISSSEGRAVPEYVHIRDNVDKGDLNDLSQMDQNNGNNDTLLGQRAFHYLDYTADGWVDVEVTELDLDTFPAYSLVSAPDFYPAVTQRSLMEWGAQAQQSEPWQDARIWETDPVDLSSDRRPADLELKNSHNQPLFSSNDDTITAVVSHFNSSRYQPMESVVFTQSKISDHFRHRCLPDAAAGVFAPGWDISSHASHLAAYGLGSPFPEDAKLCAALSAFWPAAAPDTTRTFMINPYVPNRVAFARIVAPMTDEEIGLAENALPWDGVIGPKIDYDNKKATIPNIFFADYVFNAVENRFSLAITSQVSLAQYIFRIRAMQIIRNLVNQGGQISLGNQGIALLSFKEHWQATAPNNTAYDIEVGRLANINKTANHTAYEATVEQAFRIRVDGSTVSDVTAIIAGS